jgi:hypothetical protein
MYMQEAMSKLCTDLCALDLKSGRYDLLLNRIGAGWTWKNDAHTEYELNGQFGTLVENKDYKTAEKALTSLLTARGREMHDDAILLGAVSVANDVKEYCRVAGIRLVTGGIQTKSLPAEANMADLLTQLRECA